MKPSMAKHAIVPTRNIKAVNASPRQGCEKDSVGGNWTLHPMAITSSKGTIDIIQSDNRPRKLSIPELTVMISDNPNVTTSPNNPRHGCMPVHRACGTIDSIGNTPFFSWN
jgi:hypothetical protein